MKAPSPRDLLAVAIEAVRLGGKCTLKYFNTRLKVEMKKDNTPVTRADRETEKIIRARIARSFPDHAILGEEGGASKGSPRYRWIIDPIDGTKSFIHGVPLYGVLVGVEAGGKMVAGAAYLPALDELVYASKGLGCHWNGRPTRVSKISKLSEATLLVSCPTLMMARSDACERLAARTRLQRSWGDCYGYVLVATGRAEIMMDPSINPWDCAPFLPILEEAGGCFTTWAGKPTIWGADAVGTNALLHDEVMAILKSEKRRG